MPTKDWKKVKTTGEIPAYHNEETNEDIWIVKSISNSGKFNYEVRSDISSPMTLNSFKKESQALTYAKKYMRDN